MDARMAPKYHPAPLSGGDRKALNKELGKSRAMTNILAAQSAEIAALVDFSNARVALDQTLGVTLETNHVSIEDAQAGKVQRVSSLPEQTK